MTKYFAMIVLAAASVFVGGMPAYGAESAPAWAYPWDPDFKVPAADDLLSIAAYLATLAP